jgi:hypothetical protein
LVKAVGHTTRTNGKSQTLGVAQGLVSLASLSGKYKFSLLDDCEAVVFVGGVISRIDVASCRDDSFVRQTEAGEPVSTYCLVSEGFCVWSRFALGL